MGALSLLAMHLQLSLWYSSYLELQMSYVFKSQISQYQFHIATFDLQMRNFTFQISSVTFPISDFKWCPDDYRRTSRWCRFELQMIPNSDPQMNPRWPPRSSEMNTLEIRTWSPDDPEMTPGDLKMNTTDLSSASLYSVLLWHTHIQVIDGHSTRNSRGPGWC